MTDTLEKEKIKIQYIPTADLIPADYNPRQANEEELDGVRQSIKNFGLVDPIICNSYPPRKNIIIGGHLRHKVARDLGMKEMPVVYVEISDIQREQELNLRLNKNLGAWDFDLLANFDEDLLTRVGFDSKELDRIYMAGEKPEDDEVPEQCESRAQRGDIWQLGDHRLMCGDSTSKDDVDLLMDGKKADMVFTDPPYGVNYTEKAQNLGRKGKSQINGDGDVEEAASVYGEAFKRIYEIVKEGAAYYICAPQGGDQEMMMMMMMRSTIPCKHQLIWVKDRQVFSMGRLDYDYQHEPILYGWVGSHTFQGGGRFKTSIWEIPRPKASKLHPTMKPIELIENAVLNSSKRCDIVLDLFGGSGSTLIASEKTGRICYMMEIDTKYCDVIIKRWEDYTGKVAVKL